MATLIPCPTCGKENSSSAKTCSTCGHPLSRSRNWLAGQNPLTIALVFALVVVSAYAYTQHNQAQRLTGQVASLQQRNDELTKQNNDLIARDQSLTLGAATLSRTATLLTDVLDQFGDLDTLVTTADSNAIDLIRWYAGHAQFSSADYDTANTLAGAFLAQHQQTLDEYASIKASFTSTVDQIATVLNVEPPTPTTSS